MTINLILNDFVDCHPPDQVEVRKAIPRLKNFRYKALSRETKTQLYSTGIALWCRTLGLIASKRNIIWSLQEKNSSGNIYLSIVDNDEYRRRMNHELYELHPDIDVVKGINLRRLRYLGHVSRMDKDEPAQKVFENMFEERRNIERARLRWKDQVGDTMRKLSIFKWREKAKDRTGCRNMTRLLMFTT